MSTVLRIGICEVAHCKRLSGSAKTVPDPFDADRRAAARHDPPTMQHRR
jgi:hypothetical protein